MKTDLTRRQFLKMTGTGLAIAVAATGSGFLLVSAAELEKAGPGFRPSVWLEVRPDDLVIVTVSKSEMGQGIYTSLPMIVADELDADWKNVRMEPAPAGDAYKDPVWKTQATGGSSSIRHMYEPLRKAGAAAREMLLMAAAREWGVPLKECAVAKGIVKHIKSDRSLSYGRLTQEAAKLAVPQDPVLKKENQFRYIGKDIPRLDIQGKVNGTAHFGIDTFAPGMVYAAIARPPAYGAVLAGADKEAAQKVAGVRYVVPIQGGIAVCADTIDAAGKGREALHASWKDARDPLLSTASLEKEFVDQLGLAGHSGEERRRCKDRAQPGVPQGRGTLPAALPRPCDHGAHELYGPRSLRRLRHLGADAEPVRRAGNGREAYQAETGADPCAHHVPGGRVRQAF